jgi:peptidoglycan/xylan/chitin deacetylase (PgdA/CDA1 family)
MSVRARLKNLVFDRVPGLLRKGPTSSKRVAITFDDGPDEMTEQYLDCLDRLGIPATFFVVGEHAVKHPALCREYIRRGHQVASHGYDHKRFSKLDRKGLLDQMARTDAAIGGQLSGDSWVRPPHGDLDTVALLSLRAAGYVVALWSVDPKDYDDKDTKLIIERCSPEHVGAGDVLLFHEGQQWTLDALPPIVAALHAAGLECVTMHDLFAA